MGAGYLEYGLHRVGGFKYYHWRKVMERRNLLAGLAVLALSLFLLSGTAFAHATHHKKAKPRESGSSSLRKLAWFTRCPVHFMDQGEFGASSSVADVIEVECEEVYAEHHVRISANELYSRCDQRPALADADRQRAGSEQLGLRRRAECRNDARQRRQRHSGRPGRPFVRRGRKPDRRTPTEAPYTTVTTVFTVLPPRPTDAGRVSPPRRPRSRVRNTATSRRSCRWSSRPCSPRNTSTWTSRSCTHVANTVTTPK